MVIVFCLVFVMIVTALSYTNFLITEKSQLEILLAITEKPLLKIKLAHLQSVLILCNIPWVKRSYR